MGYLPISISQMEKMAQEATQKPYYMDENGNKVEYDDTWYIGDHELSYDRAGDKGLYGIFTKL